MGKRKKSARFHLAPASSRNGWTKSRGKDSSGRPQFVYKLGSFAVVNRVTLPLVRGFSE